LSCASATPRSLRATSKRARASASFARACASASWARPSSMRASSTGSIWDSFSRASPLSSTLATGFSEEQAAATSAAPTADRILRMETPGCAKPNVVPAGAGSMGYAPAFMAIVVAVVGLGLLIAAHEAGHLVLARLMGMRVETYSLGFGPRIAGFRRGETDYRLSALPLGWYCKIAGFTPQDPAAQDPSDLGSYVNKPAWRRFLVIAAGPGLNYLVAFLIIAVLFASQGFPDLTTSRIEVLAGGPAAAAGLRTGDQVVAVDGAPVRSFDDLRRELQKPGAPAERRFEVLRQGERKELAVLPANGTISVRPDRVLVRLPVAEAIPRAVQEVWVLNAATISAIADIVRGKGTASLAGPVAIVRQASAEVKRGLGDFAGILANISVALALFNLLPVPALDGGRLVFLGYELVTRRKVNQRFESVVHVVGLLLLLGLLVSVVLFGDLQLGRRLFSSRG